MIMTVSKLALTLLTTATLLALSHGQFCIERIDEIYTAEASVTDTSFRRTYVLCPRRIIEIGTLTHNFDLQGVNANPPLPIRPNMTIQCGDTGARDNVCWMTGGDLHVDATPFRGISDTTVEGVQIQGLVFIGARKYSTWATKAGSITFIDCEWRNHTTSVVPVMLDFFDGSDAELSVTFEECSFNGNRFFGWGSQSSLVYANGQQNALKFVDTTFSNNDMTHNNTLSTTNSFIVETLGPLSMEKTCFINNAVGVSSVVVFGGSFSNIDNFVGNSTGELCGFASVFENLQQFDNFAPLCVSPGASLCLADVTLSPTSSPSAAPTPVLSDSPSNYPSPLPSASPTTPAPTLSAAPTVLVQAAPTVVGETVSPGVSPGIASPTNSGASLLGTVTGVILSVAVVLLME